jgi:hypothetical protein
MHVAISTPGSEFWADPVTYANVCVLCLRRLDAGHVCPACVIRIGNDLDDIVRLASLASIEPRTGRGSGRSVPSSRPPINVDGIDPALTIVPMPPEPSANWPTVLEICEAWCRLTLEARQMPQYGPWSHAQATTAHAPYSQTTATLTACTTFLRASLPWWESDPEQPIDDFAGEISACRRVLVRFDPDREPMGYAAFCPTDGCGAKLRYHDADEEVRCPRCRVTRDVPQLVAVVLSDPDCQDIWADPITAAMHYGISDRRLRQMVAEGKVERKAGRYRIATRHVV